jgi:hypothetical protein
MMTSERQIHSNRCNAAKSTGPRSNAGTAAVALNGIKHGLLSGRVLIKGESEADLVAFGKRLRAQLAPVGELELLLADRVVSTAWRLRRALAVEAALFNKEDTPDRAFAGYAAEKMMILSRYESTLERGLFKALHELQRLQASRQGEAVPPPEAVDVEVSDFEPDGLALHGRTTAVCSASVIGDADHAPSP